MNCNMSLKEGGELMYLYDENTNSKQFIPKYWSVGKKKN